MSKISKFIVRICFVIWLAPMVLPSPLAAYKPIELLLTVSGYLGNMLLVLSVGIFILTLIRAKQKPVADSERTTLILHDLEPEAAMEMFKDVPNAKLVCTSGKMAPCKGYYDCWLRTPGICALHDGIEGLGQQIANCDDFIIISRNLYGGFGMEIKNALDRSISFALPYFKFREREVHHQERINKRGSMTVYIYGATSDFDRNSIRSMAKANSLNLNKDTPQVVFVDCISEIKELAA